MYRVCSTAIVLVASLFPQQLCAGEPQFTRGDVNNDGSIEISDAIFLLTYVASVPGADVPVCFDAADINDDGGLDIADPINLLTFLFVPGGSPPPAPYPGCGPDPTADTLDCAGPVPTCVDPGKPPVFTTMAPTDAEVGVLYEYDADADDPDGDLPLTFSIDDGPAGAVIDETTES